MNTIDHDIMGSRAIAKQVRYPVILRFKNRPSNHDIKMLTNLCGQHGGRFDFNIPEGFLLAFSFEDKVSCSEFQKNALQYMSTLEGENL